MKKVLLTVIFFLVILSPSGVLADEITIIPTQSISPTPSTVISPMAVSYDLPYPGLLPGNPLYFLKAIRDKVIETIIVKPGKKSNFYILQADKRLASSITLFERGQDQLAETTLSKGQNYLEKSLEKAVQAGKAGDNITELLAKIHTSSQKQSQEIKRISLRKQGDIGQKLQKDYERAVDFQKRVENIAP